MKTSDIEKLIDRYFDGQTTISEERKLYRFFEKDIVPEPLRQYQEMFRDMASASLAFKGKTKKNTKRLTLKTYVRRMAAGIAAAIAIAFTVFSLHNTRHRQMTAQLYGGSYMIVHGQRIDDLSRIETQIRATLSNADDIERGMKSMTTVENAEQKLLESIDDPEQRHDIEQMLK